MSEMTIDTKEIRGMNLRNIIAIVMATISIVSTILVKTGDLEGQIKDVRKDQSQFGQLNDLNFKIFDVRIKNIEAQIDAVSKRMEENNRNK